GSTLVVGQITLQGAATMFDNHNDPSKSTLQIISQGDGAILQGVNRDGAVVFSVSEGGAVKANSVSSNSLYTGGLQASNRQVGINTTLVVRPGGLTISDSAAGSDQAAGDGMKKSDPAAGSDKAAGDGSDKAAGKNDQAASRVSLTVSPSAVTITGPIDAQGALTVAGALTANGATTINNTLTVANQIIALEGIISKAAITTDSITVQPEGAQKPLFSASQESGVWFNAPLLVRDDIVATGFLNIMRDATISGSLSVAGDLTVNGTFSPASINTGSITASNLTLSGAFSARGINGVFGSFDQLSGNDASLGNSSSDTVRIDGTLSATAPATFSDTLTAENSFSVAGETTLTGATALSSTLTVAGAAILSDALSVASNTILSGDLTVSGTALFDGPINATSGTLSLTGAISATVTSTQALLIKDDLGNTFQVDTVHDRIIVTGGSTSTPAFMLTQSGQALALDITQTSVTSTTTAQITAATSTALALITQSGSSSTTLAVYQQGIGSALSVWSQNASTTLPTAEIVSATSTALSLISQSGSASTTLAVYQQGTGNAATFLGGNVGIGTSTPQYLLHLQSTASPQTALAYDESNLFTTSVSATGQITFNSIGSQIANAFTFSDTVNIATTTSETLLTVQGSTSSTTLAVYQSGAGDIINVFDGADEIFTILDGGKVGIGSSTPSALLSLNAPAGVAPLRVGSSTRTIFTVTESQKVGINTSAPDKDLEVNSATGGTIRLSYNDFDGGATNYVDLSVDSSGDFIIGASGGTLKFSAGGDIEIMAGGSNIGTPAIPFDSIYVDTLTASTVVGVVSGGETNEVNWNINADNATADAEEMSLTFERGTSLPNAQMKWDINTKAFDFTYPLEVSTTTPSLTFDTGTAGDTDFWLAVIDDKVGDDNDYFRIGDGTSVGTNPFLTIDTSGNTGIGNINPHRLLTVGGAGYFNGNLEVAGGTFDFGNGTATTTLSAMYSKLGVGSSTPWAFLSVKAGATSPAFAVSDSNDNLDFMVTNAGSVAIGRESADAKLHQHVSTGNNLHYLTNDASGSSSVNGTWYATNYDGTANWAGIGSIGGDLRLVASSGSFNTPDIIILDSGFVGIGSTTPGTFLSVAGSAYIDGSVKSSFFTATSTTATSTFAGGLLVNTDKFSVDHQTGNVGVGTAAPLYPFHVVGQCVTGDTKLRRRRRRKKTLKQVQGDGFGGDDDGYDFDEVAIRDIAP
ncbi:MAG: hypothetical protein CO042_00780, partial [Parcubacteria group bacterium CG_4_9_14_0_2_um_filter_41_8]